MNRFLLIYDKDYYRIIETEDNLLDYEKISDGYNKPIVIFKITDELIDEIERLKKSNG